MSLVEETCSGPFKFTSVPNAKSDEIKVALAAGNETDPVVPVMLRAAVYRSLPGAIGTMLESMFVGK